VLQKTRRKRAWNEGGGRCIFPLKFELLLNNNSHLDSVFLSHGISFESHTTASSTGMCWCGSVGLWPTVGIQVIYLLTRTVTIELLNRSHTMTNGRNVTSYFPGCAIHAAVFVLYEPNTAEFVTDVLNTLTITVPSFITVLDLGTGKQCLWGITILKVQLCRALMMVYDCLLCLWTLSIVEFFKEAHCYGIWFFVHFQARVSPDLLDPLDMSYSQSQVYWCLVTKNSSVRGVHHVRYCPCLKLEAELASEAFCCIKELESGQRPK